MLKNTIVIFLLSVFVSCSNSEQNEVLLKGDWLLELNNGEDLLPVNVELKTEKNVLLLSLINGEEKIDLKAELTNGDSVKLPFPVFNSELQLIIKNDSTIAGQWVDYYRGDDYSIPLSLRYSGDNNRFKKKKTDHNTIRSRYKVLFSPNTENESPAIGLFEEKDNKLYGTFATETGDYRHLEGIIDGDSLYLSTFDGSHAYFFKAHLNGDSLSGVFYSGNHYQTTFKGVYDPAFELRNPDSLTFLKNPDSTVDFKLKDLNGSECRLTDKRFENKVVLIQIMGSWCPNCLDESVYFSSLYNTYSNKGLEIIAVGFERTKSTHQAIENLRKLKEKVGINYLVLLGGATRKESAETVFPMLNHIMSYPTTIVLDKQKQIRKIHTGFYGPSTGDYYKKYTEEMEALIETLLIE